MQSTFSGIEIGKRSLFAHQVGIHTIGHNLSNIETEGYSRQRVLLGTEQPLYPVAHTNPAINGQIGQGVIAERVSRVRDAFVEQRIVSATSDFSYWETRDTHLLSIERVYNEPSEYSLRSQLDRFWSAWQELSLRPYEGAARHAVIESAQAVVGSMRDHYVQFEQIRNIFDEQINAAVTDINAHIDDIADLNVEITKVIAAGESPNDLLDRRDQKVASLARYMRITTSDRDSDDFTVYSQGIPLIQGAIRNRLDTVGDPSSEGLSRVVWAENREQVNNPAGMLGSLLQLRDGDLQDEIDRLDSFAINFVDLVNEIHRAGYGANGQTGLDFFVEIPRVLNIDGNFDSDGDGLFDSTYIFRITGNNRLNPQDHVGIAGTITLPTANTTVDISYNPTDTVDQVIDRINNAQADIVARLNRDGQLQLKATTATDRENPDFVIRNFSDTGEFLVNYAGLLSAPGGAGAYNWLQPDATAVLQSDSFSVAPLLHPSGWIAVNPQIDADIQSIASGFSLPTVGQAAEGNGDAALAVARLRNNPALIGNAETVDDFFAQGIGHLGLRSRYADVFKETHADIVKGLVDMRDSISGVNIDEEVAELIKFQHGYAAAARFVSNIDQMLDTIINRMGV